MKKNELESHLERSLEKLIEMQKRMANTSDYTDESRKIRILEELIREQLKNENSRSSTRAVR